MSGPPLHLVPDVPGHGVARYAAEVAAAVGAPTATLAEVLRAPAGPVHVHVSDRLFAATAEEAAEQLLAVTRRHPTTLTLHDLPQPDDGAVFERRARAYTAVAAASAGWVVSSHHEADLARRHLDGARAGAVIPLPVVALPPAPPTPCATDGAATVVGVLGWIYPGKGHAEVLRAAATLPGPVLVRALGRVAEGHQPLVEELDALAASLGVRLEVAGWVPESGLRTALEAVDVPVAAHRKISASGSVNSWVAAGRRPLVTAGVYTREMAALRPGTLRLVEPDADALAAAVGEAVRDPTTTRLDAGTPTAPGLAEVAAAYVAWWASRRGSP